MLPCPACASSVRARNLDGHLGKAHGLGPGAPASAAGEAEWTGHDRGLLMAAGVLTPATVLAVVAAGVLGLPLGTGALALIAGALAAAASLLLLHRSEAGRARLSVTGDSIMLRHGLGLLRRRIGLPAQLEIGSLEAFRRDATAAANDVDANSPGDYERVGTYLRFDAESSSITVGCRDACSPSRHWDRRGWRPGRRRRNWSITLDRESFVALQYWLAAQGAIAPRSA